jgi:hypothetical protein
MELSWSAQAEDYRGTSIAERQREKGHSSQEIEKEIRWVEQVTDGEENPARSTAEVMASQFFNKTLQKQLKKRQSSHCIRENKN